MAKFQVSVNMNSTARLASDPVAQTYPLGCRISMGMYGPSYRWALNLLVIQARLRKPR